MRVLLSTYGSRADVEPMVGLAVRVHVRPSVASELMT
jgi:UDP:flavonoid glycosyltransferase YjiC (YdhE family)